jgi:hypothetical protein
VLPQRHLLATCVLIAHFLLLPLRLLLPPLPLLLLLLPLLLCRVPKLGLYNRQRC